jgi:hypothetical protein
MLNFNYSNLKKKNGKKVGSARDRTGDLLRVKQT